MMEIRQLHERALQIQDTLSSQAARVAMKEVCSAVELLNMVDSRTFPITGCSAEMEANAITAYSVRNADVVEEDLHTNGARLDDALMPRFNMEIAYRLYGILQVRDLLLVQESKLWNLFVQLYHSLYCHSWNNPQEWQGDGENDWKQ